MQLSFALLSFCAKQGWRRKQIPAPVVLENSLALTAARGRRAGQRNQPGPAARPYPDSCKRRGWRLTGPLLQTIATAPPFADGKQNFGVPLQSGWERSGWPAPQSDRRLPDRPGKCPGSRETATPERY